MISVLSLEPTDNLTIEATAALGLACTYSFRYAIDGERRFRRARGTFINTSPQTVIPALGANETAVVKSFTVRNPNAGQATVVIRVNGVEELRVTLDANNTLTDKGVFDAVGQLRSIGAAGTSPVIVRTSTTSRTIAIANGVSFTTNNVTNSGFIQGQRVRIAQTTAPAANWMEGVISAAVTATNVTVDVDRINGSGTINNWSIGLIGDNSTVVTANSNDTIALGTGSKTLNFPSPIVTIGFRVGSMVRFAADANNYMDGVVTSVTTTAITINVRSGDIVEGSGSFSSWGISIAGERGAQGTQGVQGTPGTNGLNADMTATSTDSRTIQNGSVTFAIPNSNNRGWAENTTRLRISANATNFMEGVITSLSPTSVTVNVTFTQGAGTFESWNLAVTGERGATGASGGAETVTTQNALPINWNNGKIQRFAISADLTPSQTDFLNPESGKAHVLVLENTSGASRTFTLPTHSTHFTPATRGVTVQNNRRRTLSAIFDGTSYLWAVGEELTNQ